MENKYESTNFNDFRVRNKWSPSYTKIHVDTDTGPDYCYTAIGNKKRYLERLNFGNMGATFDGWPSSGCPRTSSHRLFRITLLVKRNKSYFDEFNAVCFQGA